MDGADATGRTRLERLAALRDNFRANGIAVRHDVVDGVAHAPMRVLEPVKDFFAALLQQRAATGTWLLHSGGNS